MSNRTIVPLLERLASLGMVLAVALGLAQTAGAASITHVFVVVVPPAQDQAFNQGIRDWEKCMHDQGAS